MSPLLLLHIASGTVGLFAGATAMSLRKGSRRHGISGDVFVVAMTSLGISGVILALIKDEPGNILGGGLTVYLVLTAWAIARRPTGEPSLLDWAFLLIVFTLFTAATTWAVQAILSPTGHIHGYPPGPYIFLGSIALISLAGDIRMLLRRGIVGKQRIARHLWRMCFAWFIGSASIFLARPHLFPKFFRTSGLLIFLSVLPLLLMVFWLIRVLRKRKATPYDLKLTHASESTA